MEIEIFGNIAFGKYFFAKDKSHFDSFYKALNKMTKYLEKIKVITKKPFEASTSHSRRDKCKCTKYSIADLKIDIVVDGMELKYKGTNFGDLQHTYSKVSFYIYTFVITSGYRTSYQA
uniref:Uncharacterized protein n=1 Tax=Meloidogyne hapla TaxID=6305 RepID=A0A1I8B8W1_MELHA